MASRSYGGRWAALAVLLLAIANSQAQIVVIPQTIMAMEGDNVTFSCDSSSGIEPLLQVNGNINDPRKARISLTDTINNGGAVTFRYLFTDLTRADNGTTIQCFVNAVPSAPMVIIVDFPPRYDPPSQQFTVIEGASTMISFRLDALPRVTNYFWTRNGDPITSTARRRLTANGVIFTSIRREDTGVYTVTSVDRLGNGSATLSINVYYLPTFTAGVNSRLTPVLIGSNTTLSCSVMANPSVTNLTLTSNENSNVAVTSDSFIITRAGASGTQNEGNYTCRAVNSVGVTEFVYNVVLGNAPDINVKIDIQRTPTTIIINVTYTDSSDPPVTHFVVHVGDMVYQRELDEFPLILNSTQFASGRAVPVVVEAVSLFGSLNFTDTFNIPRPTPDPSSGANATPTPSPGSASGLTLSISILLVLLVTALFCVIDTY